jgi:chemotaxis protein CheX
MSTHHERFLNFSRPFLDALKDTFETMVQTTIKPHSPEIKKGAKGSGDISAMIGMNGQVEKDGDTKNFKGLLVFSFPEEVYLKIAGAMLFEEFTEYNEDIADTGSEIANIVMGNAKSGLSEMGYKIEMASPSTVRGPDHEITYPAGTIIVVITISSDHGDFKMELCYQEV